MRRRISAETIYLIYVSMNALLFILVKNIREVYRMDIVHATGYQLIILGTTLEITHFLFEIPTGIVADKMSRKLSVIFGLLLIGLSFLMEGFFPFFFIVLISQIILGMGDTFTSGADEAWIADELNGGSLENLFLRGAQVSQVLAIVGLVVSGYLGNFNESFPYILSGLFMFVLALFLIFFMRETNFHKSEGLHSIHHMVQTFKTAVHFIRSKPTLVFLASIALFYGLYSEGFDRLWTIHFFHDIHLPVFFSNVEWVTIINACAMGLSILAVEFIKRRLKTSGHLEKLWLLTGINLMMLISLFFFAIIRQYEIAMTLYFTFYVLRRTNDPIMRAWMNTQIDSKIRATVLSTFGQIDAFGQIVGGLILALLAYLTNVTVAMVVSSFLLGVVVILYLLFIRKYKSLNV